MQGPGGLASWIAACLPYLRHRGRLSLILPANILTEALSALAGPFGSVAVTPLWPKSGQAAKRVVVQAVKGGRGGAVLHAGLVLHNDDGSYTEQARAVLSGASRLPGWAASGEKDEPR